MPEARLAVVARCMMPWIVAASSAGCNGCGGGGVERDASPDAGEPLVCPAAAPAERYVMGDANGDGTVDISDGVWIQRHLYAGGPPPPCAAAANVAGLGPLGTSSSVNLWHYLFTGTVRELPTLERGACDALEARGDPPPCAAVALDLVGPARVEESPGAIASFEARARLGTSGLERGPEAWSIAIAADGCRVVAATTDGTDAADRRDDPPGRRSTGYAHTQTSDGGATSAVVLSWLEPLRLEPEETPRPVLALTVEATTPSDGCASCRLRFDPGRAGAGQPTALVVTVDGWSYTPTTRDAAFDVCAR